VQSDFIVFEMGLPLLPRKDDWEECTTINPSWSYTPAPAKPLNQLLPYLIRAWGMGGNVLLNVGPNAEGVIPADQAERLREIGAWMKVNGESIYGTKAGPFTYLPWGTATCKGNTVYLQILDWPADGRLKVPLLNEVKQARLLGGGANDVLKTSREKDRIIVQLPSKAPDAVANVVALDIVGEPKTDYVSVVRNKPVQASADQKTATLAVDEREGTIWRNPATTGWLEMDAGRPVTVATLRLSPCVRTIKNCALEYKDGNEWKPILTGEKFSGNPVVKDFPPVTAQVFRLNIIECDNPAMISNVELYPPL